MFPSQKWDRVKMKDAGYLASMGPGCFHPRNVDDKEYRLAYSLLQWGRDVSIPEMGPGEDEGCRLPSFNGAGMFPSQKCG